MQGQVSQTEPLSGLLAIKKPGLALGPSESIQDVLVH